MSLTDGAPAHRLRHRRDLEPPVCVCFGIGARAILAAADSGCDTVEAIGAATRAGTNCGSCRPEIRTLLAKMPA